MNFLKLMISEGLHRSACVEAVKYVLWVQSLQESWDRFEVWIFSKRVRVECITIMRSECFARFECLKAFITLINEYTRHCSLHELISTVATNLVFTFISPIVAV